MWILLVPVCLAIFSPSLTASEPHYVITAPENLKEVAEEKVCVTFLDLKGPTDIKIELKHEDQVHVVAEAKITSHDHSECYTFQVPKIQDGGSDWLLHVSANGENINVDESKKVVITKRDDNCFIQTDKSTYKPGETVKFRLVSIDPDFRPLNKQHPVIEITDPNKNRIAQWLDVSTKQGFADFSFHLANELAFGDYNINIAGACEKSFLVHNYVSKRFELHLNFQKDVSATDKSFHVDVCGSYTYGRPVEGVIDLSVCAATCVGHVWYCSSADAKCINIKGEKTDSNGCVSRDIELAYFDLSAIGQHVVEITTNLTEDGTGHSEDTRDLLYINTAAKLLKFVERETFYYKGFPYHGKVKLTDKKKQPIANEAITIYVYSLEDTTNPASTNLVTDSHGIADFTLNTSDWSIYAVIKVRLTSDGPGDDRGPNIWTYDFQQSHAEDWIYIMNFYSNSESLLSIKKHPKDVTCNSDQSVTVEYDINKKNLHSDTDHLHFYSMLITKSGIFSYKDHKVDIKAQADSPNFQGSFPLNFHLDEDFFPKFTLLVFSVLPNGDTMARSTEYIVSPCMKGKVKISFSEEEVRPGEDVNLEVTAEAGSLCSVRSVDKGYLLQRPHYDSRLIPQVSEILRELREEQEFGMSPFSFFMYMSDYSNDDAYKCPDNTIANPDSMIDVYKLFRKHKIHIFTNTEIKEPKKCVSREFSARSAIKKKKTGHKDKKSPKKFTRSNFQDTWLFELVPVGSDGHTVLNRTTPHTITKWVTDAFCLGTSGISSVGDVELTTFQPYFIDLILPYSVVQGEKFTIQAMVFSYVKKCILIVVSLSDSEDLVTTQNKEQTRCVCERHSHMFSWDVSVLKTKTLKIHVESSFMEVEGECTQDALHIGEDRRKDSVEKTIVVKPRGYEKDTTKTFIFLPSDNREALTINIDTPERLVKGSQRAHIIVQGDFLANIVVNLDNILWIPQGCGEQNIGKFTRAVYMLAYLESTQEETPETRDKITERLVEGYQTLLTLRNESGSFANFPGGSENIWLTALILNAFIGAQKFIYIDESHIDDAVNWLHSKQLPDGCFNAEGDYYNNELHADELVPRTAFITIALLENHHEYKGSIVENALSCLRKSVDIVTSLHTQALLAYAFTLSGDTELRDQMLKKLDDSAVKKDGMKHWETSSYIQDLMVASYVTLALLSEKTTTIKNVEDSGDIIHWIVTQQNAWGGFHSSEDTTIAVQALAKYAKAITHKKGDSTVTIKSKSGFEKTVHVDRSNSLLVQTVHLSEIPGEYTVSVTGNGFVYLQSHSHYNILPEQPEKGYFSFNVSSEPATCTHTSWRRFDVHIDVSYSGKRENTNMAMIIVETVSGYVPEKDSLKELKKNPLVDRTEVSAQNISIYLTKLTHEPVSFIFTLEQEHPVQNLQPATAMVFDYYDPEEHTVVEYSAPCNEDFRKPKIQLFSKE